MYAFVFVSEQQPTSDSSFFTKREDEGEIIVIAHVRR
jgi:hypothetical protein